VLKAAIMCVSHSVAYTNGNRFKHSNWDGFRLTLYSFPAQQTFYRPLHQHAHYSPLAECVGLLRAKKSLCVLIKACGCLCKQRLDVVQEQFLNHMKQLFAQAPTRLDARLGALQCTVRDSSMCCLDSHAFPSPDWAVQVYCSGPAAVKHTAAGQQQLLPASIESFHACTDSSNSKGIVCSKKKTVCIGDEMAVAGSAPI